MVFEFLSVRKSFSEWPFWGTLMFSVIRSIEAKERQGARPECVVLCQLYQCSLVSFCRYGCCEKHLFLFVTHVLTGSFLFPLFCFSFFPALPVSVLMTVSATVKFSLFPSYPKNGLFMALCAN